MNTQVMNSTKHAFTEKMASVLIFYPKAILYAICTILITVVLFVALINYRTSVSAAPDQALNKYYTSIEIQTGDTLWDIADDYEENGYSTRNSFLKEIQSLNNIDDSEITSGCYLIIPYYAETPR